MARQSQTHTGGCLCGAIRYEADCEGSGVGYCHCKFCQKGLGGPFSVSIDFPPSKFRFVSGEPVWFQSSDHGERGFCAKCGTPIGYRRDDVELVVIWVGTLDKPEAVDPTAHFHSNSKLPWVDIQSHLPDKTEELASYQGELDKN